MEKVNKWDCISNDEIDRLTHRDYKRIEAEEYQKGYQAGGNVDKNTNAFYQRGQRGRQENDGGKQR